MAAPTYHTISLIQQVQQCLILASTCLRVALNVGDSSTSETCQQWVSFLMIAPLSSFSHLLKLKDGGPPLTWLTIKVCIFGTCWFGCFRTVTPSSSSSLSDSLVDKQLRLKPDQSGDHIPHHWLENSVILLSLALLNALLDLALLGSCLLPVAIVWCCQPYTPTTCWKGSPTPIFWQVVANAISSMTSCLKRFWSRTCLWEWDNSCCCIMILCWGSTSVSNVSASKSSTAGINTCSFPLTSLMPGSSPKLLPGPSFTTSSASLFSFFDAPLQLQKTFAWSYQVGHLGYPGISSVAELSFPAFAPTPAYASSADLDYLHYLAYTARLEWPHLLRHPFHLSSQCQQGISHLCYCPSCPTDYHWSHTSPECVTNTTSPPHHCKFLHHINHQYWLSPLPLAAKKSGDNIPITCMIAWYFPSAVTHSSLLYKAKTPITSATSSPILNNINTFYILWTES